MHTYSYDQSIWSRLIGSFLIIKNKLLVRYFGSLFLITNYNAQHSFGLTRECLQSNNNLFFFWYAQHADYTLNLQKIYVASRTRSVVVSPVFESSDRLRLSVVISVLIVRALPCSTNVFPRSVKIVLNCCHGRGRPSKVLTAIYAWK